MEEIKKEIQIKTEDGKIIDGQIVFSFEANGDNFVLYKIKDRVFAAKYDETNQLTPVENDEWSLVEKIFNQYIEENEEKNE